MAKVNRITVVKSFFSTPEKPVSFDELKKLGSAGIKELAPDCAKALGVELEE